MIDIKDIEKLALLSRMNLTEDEKVRFATEIDSILGYVQQIQKVSDDGAGGKTGAAGAPSLKTPDMYAHRNVLRDDIDNRSLNEDTSILVDLSPASQDGYIKVKKILN